MSNIIEKALLVEQDSNSAYSNILHVVFMKRKNLIGKKFDFVMGVKMTMHMYRQSTKIFTLHLFTF